MDRKWLKYERETSLTGFLIVAILLVINTTTVYLLNNSRQEYQIQLNAKLSLIADLSIKAMSEFKDKDKGLMPLGELVESSDIREIGLVDDSGKWVFSTSPYRLRVSPGSKDKTWENVDFSSFKETGLGKPYKTAYGYMVNYFHAKKVNGLNIVVLAPAGFLAAMDISQRVLYISLLVIGVLIFVFLFFYVKNILAPFQKMADSARDQLQGNGIHFDSDVEMVVDTYQRMIDRLKDQGRHLSELYDSEKTRADQLEHYSRQILDSIDKGIVTVNHAGNIISFNRSAQELLGSEGLNQIVTQTNGIKIGESNIIEHEKADGSKIAIQLERTSFKGLDGNVSGNNIIISDVTESRRLEELTEYSERAELINSAAANLLQKISPLVQKIKDSLAAFGSEGKVASQIFELENCLIDGSRVFSLENIKREDGFSQDIICQSDEMKAILELIAKVAVSDSTVLITGESGTGKELVAREIHGLSHRNKGPFIALNCAALPETLLESELFGYVKGAFTGANRDKPGLFQMAENGSFFLDEVGELSALLQAKLLRVVQEREMVPVGGTKPVKIVIRLIAATNKKLEELVTQGKFREDLFYRLNVFPIHIPPLRERVADIEPLAILLVKKYALKLGNPVSGISVSAVKSLKNYSWPGNVRQLENALERAVIMAKGNRIETADISFMTNSSESPGDTPDLGDEGLLIASAKASAQAEKAIIEKTLKQTSGNKSQAARRLKISYRVMLKKIKDYGLD